MSVCVWLFPQLFSGLENIPVKTRSCSRRVACLLPDNPPYLAGENVEHSPIKHAPASTRLAASLNVQSFSQPHTNFAHEADCWSEVFSSTEQYPTSQLSTGFGAWQFLKTFTCVDKHVTSLAGLKIETDKRCSGWRLNGADFDNR